MKLLKWQEWIIKIIFINSGKNFLDYLQTNIKIHIGTGELNFKEVHLKNSSFELYFQTYVKKYSVSYVKDRLLLKLPIQKKNR